MKNHMHAKEELTGWKNHFEDHLSATYFHGSSAIDNIQMLNIA